MASHLSPTNRFLPMYGAIAASLLFGASSQLDSFLKGLCFGAGFALLVLSVLMVARLRSGPAATSGWRPTSDPGQRPEDQIGVNTDDRDQR
ncbi:MAG: hypothetical protein ABIN79_01310 [Marmoricola sp.]